MPTKISALPAASALTGAETVPLVQSSTTKGGLISQIGTYVRSLFTTTPATITEGGTGAATAATARTALGALAVSGDQLTGKLIFKAGLNNIASAATVDLTVAGAGNTVHITGAAGINAWTMTSGQVVDVVFDGAPLLTYHATNNNLPSGANIQAAANDRARYWYDGTAVWCIAYQKASGAAVIVASVTSAPVRQTVLAIDVDNSGYAVPTITGGTGVGFATLTVTGSITATAAAGMTSDYTGTITTPSWTGLSTNGVMYLYLDITSAGVVTTGSTTNGGSVAPNYRWGGADVTTNLVHTFNIQQMTMKQGNGTTADVRYRVFVGEVLVVANVVSTITWYAPMGRYQSALTALPAASTAQAYAHNIGVPGNLIEMSITGQCTSGVAGFSSGDQVASVTTGAAAGTWGADILSTVGRLSSNIIADSQGFQVKHKTTGADTGVGTANFSLYVSAKRRF